MSVLTQITSLVLYIFFIFACEDVSSYKMLEYGIICLFFFLSLRFNKTAASSLSLMIFPSFKFISAEHSLAYISIMQETLAEKSSQKIDNSDAKLSFE